MHRYLAVPINYKFIYDRYDRSCHSGYTLIMKGNGETA